jgi:ABC-type transport system involved in multi-copper enzyme maturation permease subunit
MSSNLIIWVTPLWLLAVGVSIGAVILLVLYGLLWLVSRPAARAVPRLVREGVLLPISYVALALVLLAIFASPWMPVASVVHSLSRLPFVRPIQQTLTIPAGAVDHEVRLRFFADELQSYIFQSDQNVVIGVEPGKSVSEPLIEVAGGTSPAEAYVWRPGGKVARKFDGEVTGLFISNDNSTPAELRIDIRTDIPIVEVRHIHVTAAAMVSVYLLYLLIAALFPGLSVIAMATSREATLQPIYALAVCGGAFALLFFIYLPYNTFGEDVKMLKDSGLTTIMVLAIAIALWTASVAVAEEIEGRTALTLLSKPISRRQFVLGKFLGIVWPLLLLFVVLGVILLATVSYKVVYDARETTNPDPNWQMCYAEMIGTVPGLALALMEAIVFAAISVAVSTKLSMVPNLIICGAVYVLGHLIPPIVQSSIGQLEYVAFFGRLSALIVPLLDVFNIQAAVAGGRTVPAVYVATAFLYCILYSTAMMLLALIFFEDRDLA